MERVNKVKVEDEKKFDQGLDQGQRMVILLNE